MYKNELINSRSILYNLEPIGIGTGMIESLTSYLTRLALEHNTTVGNLVNKLLIPTMSKEYLLRSSDLGGNRFYEGAKTLNGFMENSFDIVDALEKLTCRNDLKNLTLLGWKGIIPLRGLLKKSLSWCPSCINEWIEKGTTVYYPLIWYLSSIKTCHIHSCQLINTCPFCHKKQDILRRQAIVGLCQNCSNRLDKDTKTGTTEPKDCDWQRFVIRNIGILLTSPEELLLDGNTKLVKNLNLIYDEVFDGSLIRFSQRLGFARNSISGWLKGNVTPTLENQLYVCFRLSIEIEHLFTFFDLTKIKVLEQKKNEGRSLFFNEKGKFDTNIVQKQLEEILQSEEAISMAAAAVKIRVNKRTLYRNFRDLCMQISNKHKQYLEERKKQRISNLKKVIEEAFLLINEQGIYPSRRKMESYMGKPGVLKERELQQHWKNLLIK